MREFNQNENQDCSIISAISMGKRKSNNRIFSRLEFTSLLFDNQVFIIEVDGYPKNLLGKSFVNNPICDIIISVYPQINASFIYAFIVSMAETIKNNPFRLIEE